MPKPKISTRLQRWRKTLLIGLLTLAILLVGAAFAVHRVYNQNLKAVSGSQTSQTITIPIGSTSSQIAKKLKDAGVIRSTWAFEWYLRNSGLRDKLQAGTYSLLPSQTIPEIVTILTQGKVTTELLTILPGQRIDQIRTALINYGFSEAEVDKALNPNNYSNHPALVDKPKKASLEGYLYPETFHRTSSTTAEDIITASLDEMQKRLTPELRKGITRRGLTVHEGVTLASIIEQEVYNPADKPTVAQVFLKRLKLGMQLGSDVTAFYGAIIADQEPSVDYDSPYNTRLHSTFPPGPISNVSASSLEAIVNPSKTDYLFFVAGDGPDEGKTYFSKTLEEHEELTRLHCRKLCN